MKKQYRISESDKTWAWSEQDSKQAIITVLDQVISKKASKKVAIELLIIAGLIEEVH